MENKESAQLLFSDHPEVVLASLGSILEMFWRSPGLQNKDSAQVLFSAHPEAVLESLGKIMEVSWRSLRAGLENKDSDQVFCFRSS